jgi:glycosyltransferase involved in cell wall biosynthesis
LTYLITAAGEIFFGERADVYVCLSTPPLVAAFGKVAQLRGSRFVYKVEDLYPDVAVALGAFEKRGIVDWFFSRVSSSLLRSADAVVALDTAMAEVLRERGARRVEVIPNWADGAAIYPDAKAGDRFRCEHGLEGQFVALYSGNLGLAHRFDAVCEAARKLEESESNVVFFFVGGGPRLEEVRYATRDLENIRFLPYQPRDRLHELYNSADLHLISLRDEVAGLLVPSKYAAALAAGKPVILVGGSGADLYGEIKEERVGWVCEHEPERVATAIRAAAGDRLLLAECGGRARALFERKYSRKAATKRWGELLREVAQGSAPPED